MKKTRFPMRYLPKQLTKKDKKKQFNMLMRSKKQYKKKTYVTRQRVASFKNKKSNHVSKARQVYGVDTVAPSAELARKTGCSLAALNQIVKKGEGAYFSSGSRPNQTARSWGLARLASSLTAGKAAAVDYGILEKGCKPSGKAFRLARQAREKYGHGHGKTRKTGL